MNINTSNIKLVIDTKIAGLEKGNKSVALLTPLNGPTALKINDSLAPLLKLTIKPEDQKSLMETVRNKVITLETNSG